MKTAYTYTLLRYVHDVSAGESLNIGVVLHAPAARFFGARLQANYGRLRKAFPALDGESHRDVMRYLQTRFDEVQTKVSDELALDGFPADAGAAAMSVLPKDDSSLQWSPLGGGLSDDHEMELTRLYARLVTANDGPRTNAGRSDEVIWSVYRAPLVREKVLLHLAPHKVVTENDEVQFEHAWRNGEWSCLEPFSLDYLDAESIKGKAHRLLGQMYGVKEGLANHRLYLMVGEPQLDRCKSAAQKALNLLHKSLPLPHRIVREIDAVEFSREVAAKIKEHSGEVAGNAR